MSKSSLREVSTLRLCADTVTLGSSPDGATEISVMTPDFFSGNALTESNRIALGGRGGGAERVGADLTTSSEDSFSISDNACEYDGNARAFRSPPPWQHGAAGMSPPPPLTSCRQLDVAGLRLAVPVRGQPTISELMSGSRAGSGHAHRPVLVMTGMTSARRQLAQFGFGTCGRLPTCGMHVHTDGYFIPVAPRSPRWRWSPFAQGHAFSR